MSGSSISKNDPQSLEDVIPVYAPAQAPINPVSTPSGDSNMGVSTLSGSRAASSAVSPDAATPHLVSPRLAMDAGDDIDRKNVIAQNILDRWLEGIREDADRVAEKLRSPEYRAWLDTQSATFIAERQRNSAAATELAIATSPEYVAWVLSLSPLNRAAEQSYQQSINMRVGLADGIDSYRQTVSSSSPEALFVLPLMAATFVVGQDIIGQAVRLSDVSSTPVVNPTAFDQIWAHVARPYITDDLAELGLIGALFATGALYQTTVQDIGETYPSVKTKSIKFGNLHAKTIIQLVIGGTLDGFLRGMLSKKVEGGEPLSEGRKEELIAIVKIVLLSTALMLLYKIQTGKITGQEFEDMFSGKMSVDPKKMEAKLIQLMRHYMAALPSKESEKILKALSDYMDKDPSIDNMLDPGQVFEGLLQSFRPVGPIAA